ncbi:hypothetical protein HWV62_35344 [Athelia sp. TMB]|nr:hypothetical protein HWV62_30039 [Athelia sp. TMB]KAF7986347.1 hypothetical protein HWV62_35344 [Athelia sp. TMB]
MSPSQREMTSSDRTYHPAFSEEDATIVLTSSDGIHYRLHPFTLRTTSGFFRDMISLPQKSASEAGDTKTIVEEEQIALDEGNKVLTPLLKMISGQAVEKWTSLDEMKDVLDAAQKYDMPGPLSIIRSTVASPPSYITLADPLRLYIIAAQHDWEEEARAASVHTLEVCLYDKTLESVLHQVPSAYLLKLFRLHRVRRDKFREYIERDNRRFGLDICVSCRAGNQLTPLEQIANRFVMEMDQKPGGNFLAEGMWKEWPLYKGAMCPHNPGTLLATLCGDKIVEDLRVALKSLPATT